MIEGYIIGQETVLAKFDKMPSAVHGEVLDTITRLTINLQRYVKAEKLSGQALKVKTGTLRRSINQSVSDNGTSIVGRVGTNLAYGRAHEYGFHGAVTVKAHLRNITQAFGRSITPTEVTVRTFTRNMNLPERSFLRTALAELTASGALQTQLAAAVVKGSR
jgi:phage gpG-like protein